MEAVFDIVEEVGFDVGEEDEAVVGLNEFDFFASWSSWERSKRVSRVEMEKDPAKARVMLKEAWKMKTCFWRETGSSKMPAARGVPVEKKEVKSKLPPRLEKSMFQVMSSWPLMLGGGGLFGLEISLGIEGGWVSDVVAVAVFPGGGSILAVSEFVGELVVGEDGEGTAASFGDAFAEAHIFGGVDEASAEAVRFLGIEDALEGSVSDFPHCTLNE